MAKKGRNKKSTADDEQALSLGGFEQVADEQGLSLDDLSGSLANLMGEGSDPFADSDDPEPSADESDEDPASPDAGTSHSLGRRVSRAADVLGDGSDDGCPVTPQSILEAMLFVGHPSDEPLTSRQVASLMRGVSQADVDQFVTELNETYKEHNCPYLIESVGVGYRLSLRESAAAIREMFYGKVREARLSQAAIDVLSIVAYHQPIDKVAVNELRREPSGRLLNQLVRRELLKVERQAATESQPRQTLYQTTDRFLTMFNLESLDDLPRNQDFDRR